MIANVKALIDAENEGYTFFSTWRKQPTQTTSANIWFDLSMSPGNPVPNYYIGASNKFTRLAQSTDGGIPHGGNASPRQKYLRVLEAQTSSATAVPLPMMILDYLGFYPFIDESITDEQALDNTVGINRFIDGLGVYAMPVVVAGHTGGQNFKIRYTNSDGVSDRISPECRMTTQIVNGTIISSCGATINSVAPFIPMQRGDKGIRSIEGITFLGTGDIGLISIALVKVVATHSIRGIDAPVEQDYFMTSSQMPMIADDAYLNIICNPAGSVSGAPIHGYIKTVNI